MDHKAIPQTGLGATGAVVTRVGLGGEGILRTYGEEAGAAAVIEEAVAQGVTYFDSAPAYSDSERYLGSVWKERPEARNRIFQTSKSARRSYKGAREELTASLARLHTDHLDLWQIHDVRTEEDAEAISAPGGALEAFIAAREEGIVKNIGVTGHHDPKILTACVREWPVDTVLLPVNPAEGALGGFLTETLPEARKKGLGVIGMKVFGGGHYLNPQARLTPGLLLRYALSQPVDLVVIGCSMPDHVRILADIARDFSPIPQEAQAALLESFAPHARKLAFYRGAF